ncbi:hypothetical protein Tco_1463224 [Tanacetum coccineum]
MFKAELSVVNAAKILAETSKERVKTYNRRRRRSTDSSQVSTVAGLFSTAEDIQDTNEELARNFQEEEQTKFDQERKAADDIDWSKIVEQAQERKAADDINWSKIVEQAQERQSGSMIRYHSFKKKPVTVAQARKNMMVYLKNMANYKMKYFKGMSYDQIRPIFKGEYRKVQTLFKKDSEFSKSEKKRVAEEALLQESFKKLRTTQASGSEPFHQEKSTEEPKELSKEDARDSSRSRKYWKIIRVGNITEAYQGFEDMLKAFDREDLDTLWSLVKEKFRSVEPTEDMERALWVELKRLYEPDKEDTL